MKKVIIPIFILSGFFSEAQNVGINTSSPTARLHVNGSLKITNGSQGEDKVLTSDDAGLATWKTPYKSIFKATGFEGTFTIAPSTTRKLTDWKTVELNVGANSIFVNAQGDLFVLKDGYYKVSARVTVFFNDPGDSHFIDLFIVVNGTRKAVTRSPVPTNDNALDANQKSVCISISSIFQLNAQDKISIEFYNGAAISNTSAQVTGTYNNNIYSEFTVVQL